MTSVNKVILVGNLGKDPELRRTTSDVAVCTISLATTRSWSDKTTGEKAQETEWHRVVFYNKLAEIADKYLEKGRTIYIEGYLKTRKWKDKEGNDIYTTEVVADSMQMLGARQEPTAQTTTATATLPAPIRSTRPPPGAPVGAVPAVLSRRAAFDDMADDIPF